MKGSWEFFTMRCDGLFGHRPLMDRISRLLEEGRLPHAVLLTGPPGVGKSLAARALAAGRLCARYGCGECPDCKRVRSLAHPDFHLLAPAEGRRDILIGQTRDLIAGLSSKSYEGRGKAAVIDPADRMNDESQNAFLKTLEEPSPGTLLILVSSRPERLLSTVRSRCQPFRFGRLGGKEMGEFVSSFGGEAEGMLPEGLAAGCPGRLVALEEVDGRTARSLLLDFITSTSLPSPVAFTVRLMSWAQGASGLQEVRRRIKIFLDLAAAFLRDLVVLSLAPPGAGGHAALNSDLAQRLAEALPLYDTVFLVQALDRMTEPYADLEGYVDPGLVVENAAILIRNTRKRS